jgi:peptide/nickel transport system substrate-binding protein
LYDSQSDRGKTGANLCAEKLRNEEFPPIPSPGKEENAMKKSYVLVSIAMFVLLGSCAQPTPETIIQTMIETVTMFETVTVIETVEVIKEGETVYETVEVIREVEVQIEVTPTPVPLENEVAEAVLGVLPRNETLIVDIFSGSVNSPDNFNPWVNEEWGDRGVHNLANEPLWTVDFATGQIINGLAVGNPIYNEEFTSLEIPLRDGVAWDDGTPFTAADVVFTIETLMAYEGFNAFRFFNENVESVFALDDYTVAFELKAPNSRFHTAFLDRLGCTWIMPKHIFERVNNPVTFDFNPFVGTGPYKLHSYDQAGSWTIWEKREDWEKSPTGILYGEPKPQYIVFQNFPDDFAKIQAQLHHKADLVNLSSDGFKAALTQLSTARAYQPTFPWVINIDPAITGITYNTAREPYDNPEVRWALTLAIDINEYIHLAIDGAGTMSPIHIPHMGSYPEDYIEPMQEWLEEFEITLSDGDRFAVYDPNAPTRLVDAAKARGYIIPEDPEYIDKAFGLGWYKYAPEVAEELLINNGFSRNEDGGWLLPDDTPWKIVFTTGTDPSHVGTRNAMAAVTQWKEFGIDAEVLTTEKAADLIASGDFEVSSSWPASEPWGAGSDLYPTLKGFYTEDVMPIGESTIGHPSRWSNPEMDAVIEDLFNTDPTEEQAMIDLGTEGLKLMVESMPGTPTFGEIGYISWDEYYWINWPGAENPYTQPYAYWGPFKYMTPFLEPTGR